MASDEYAGIRLWVPSLDGELLKYLTHAQQIVALPLSSIGAEDRLDVLAEMGRGPLRKLAEAAAAMLAERRAALAEDRQRILLVVLVLFFGGLIAGAYIVLGSGQQPRRAGPDVAERSAAAKFVEIMESLDEGIALFDAEDTLAFCNERYREAYSTQSLKIVPGIRYETILSGLVKSEGFFRDAKGSEEEWSAARLARYRASGDPQKEYLSDGRCLQVSNYRTPGGGVVSLVADVHRGGAPGRGTAGQRRAHARHDRDGVRWHRHLQ